MSPRATRVPAIPAPTDSNLLEVAKAIKGLLDVREGIKGDELDAFITRRDVNDALFRATNQLNGGGGGGGGLIGPPGIPGGTTPPVLDLTPPPAPTGVTATAALTSITIQWDSLPGGYAPNHAYAEVWRSSDSLQGNAILIGTSLTRFFVDAVGTTGVGFHYWVRFRSKADIVGPFQGTEGAFAQTGLVGGVNLAPLLITADKLAAGALEGINLVANPNAELGTADWIADGAAGGGGTFGVDTTTPLQGAQSFRLVKASGTATVGAVSRAFQVIPGESYAIRLLARGATAGRAMVRVNHGPSAPAGDFMTAALRAGFTDVTQPKDSGGTNTDVGTASTSIDVRYTVPAGQSWVSLAILADGTGAPDTLWFDAVSMGRAIRAAALEAGTIAVGSAAIANGAIRRALIEDLAVDNAKIANLNAAKITAGFLDADRIAVGSIDARIANIDAAIIGTGILNIARIADGSITVAKIFEIIFSNNWDGVYTPGGGGGGGGPGADPNFNDVVLLASFDGANGSTTLTDESVPPATLTAVGGAALSTAQSRFGGASLFLDGIDDRVTTNRANGLGAQPFTIECWVRAIEKLRAQFTASPLTGEAPLTVNFTNQSTGLAPLTYGWDFTNDGAIDSAAENPSFTYTAPGTYAVRLVASGTQGSDEELKTGYVTVSTPSDPFFSNVRLLLHLDGANGSVVFTDTSVPPASVSQGGSAAISTARSRFGGASLFLDGVDDWLQTTRGQSIGSGQFTLEAFIRPTAAQTGRIISSQSAFTPLPAIAIRVDSNGGLTFLIRDSGGGGLLVLSSAPGLVAMNDSAWYHVAATRNAANRIDIWLDGANVASATSSTSPASAPQYVIGVFGSGQEHFAGYIDEVRITEGVCRYNAPFTPPTAPFPDQ
jgi:PKD repeat protein